MVSWFYCHLKKGWPVFAVKGRMPRSQSMMGALVSEGAAEVNLDLIHQNNLIVSLPAAVKISSKENSTRGGYLKNCFVHRPVFNVKYRAPTIPFVLGIGLADGNVFLKQLYFTIAFDSISFM